MCKYPFDDPQWSDLASSRHRDKRAIAKKKWERSLLAGQTVGGKSKYDPNLLPRQIEFFEMQCVRDERFRHGELPPTACDSRKFYRKFESYIGASEGKKTEYIMVIYQSNGTVHGYPVTRQYLRNRGADV